MPLHDSLIAPTADAALERQLRDRLARRSALGGGFGQLEALALRLGLVSGALSPRLRDPALVLFCADHGLAMDSAGAGWAASTAERAQLALQGRLPCAMLARLHGLALQIVDCGIAQDMPPHPRVALRKVAHGSRHVRLGPAMSAEQCQAAMRVGMEFADGFAGNALAFAAIGQGSSEAASLLLARLDEQPLSPLLPGDTPTTARASLEAALERHASARDPLDALAALGGYDIAVMVGAMLVAASKRHLLLIDGLPACAALRVAASIAPPVIDYALFCRSHDDPALDQALAGFHTGAVLELGLRTVDGTGAVLAWPLVRSAAALLSDLVEPQAVAGIAAAAETGAGMLGRRAEVATQPLSRL